MIVRHGYRNNMKKKILITGSSGFIGNHLSAQLFNKYNLFCFDKKDKGDIFANKIESSLAAADAVIHLAALTSVEQSFKNPQETFITNVLGTARIVELCVKYKKKLIYPSSAAIYHPELSSYAHSKYLAEEIVKGVMGKIPVVILRLSNVYGDNMNPDSGSVMFNFLKSKKLVIFGDGEQTRDFISVRDVVSIMEDALKKKWNNEIVEVGSGKSYTMNYVAGLFAHYMQKNLEYKPPRREIKWSIADTKNLKRLYKKKLLTNLSQDVEELCKKQAL